MSIVLSKSICSTHFPRTDYNYHIQPRFVSAHCNLINDSETFIADLKSDLPYFASSYNLARNEIENNMNGAIFFKSKTFQSIGGYAERIQPYGQRRWQLRREQCIGACRRVGTSTERREVVMSTTAVYVKADGFMARAVHLYFVLLIRHMVLLLSVYVWQAKAFYKARKEVIAKKTTTLQNQWKKKTHVKRRLVVCSRIIKLLLSYVYFFSLMRISIRIITISLIHFFFCDI